MHITVATLHGHGFSRKGSTLDFENCCAAKIKWMSRCSFSEHSCAVIPGSFEGQDSEEAQLTPSIVGGGAWLLLPNASPGSDIQNIM